MKHMDNALPITTLSRLILGEAKRRRQFAETERHRVEEDEAHCLRIAEAWTSARSALLAEIASANTMLALHDLPERCDISDHAVREAECLARYDLTIDKAVACVSVCGYRPCCPQD
jgi:hypothetical protein